MTAWRLVKSKYASTAFSGAGARLDGGRWNSPGIPMVYAASSISLAMLEVLMHLPADELRKSHTLFEIQFDEALMDTVALDDLPRNWRMRRPPAALARIGDEWISGRHSAVLRVPSVIVASEYNYLLNPSHPSFTRIKIGPRQPLRFDPNLIKTTAN